jgi:transposase-like protein
MAKKRTNHSAEFKAKVALDALREQKTLAQMSKEYSLQAQQISAWKKHLQDGAPSVFDKEALQRQNDEAGAREQTLYARIGQLQMELEWVKKKLGLPNGR